MSITVTQFAAEMNILLSYDKKFFLTNSVTVGIFLMYMCRVKCECWICDILQSLQADVSIVLMLSRQDIPIAPVFRFSTNI